jgi:uncharacterized membrane protein YccC
MTDRFGANEALFSAKCLVAAMLAYYIALRIGLTRPYWAVTTSYIVAQPLAGAVLSKAMFRVLGTVLGAGAAIVMVPNLVNAPELLSLALALWLGLCLYISLLDRTPRAYVFLLAGYTASIVGLPAVGAPGEIFTTVSLRVQEITLGILCGSVVHGLILPRTVTATLLGRIDAIINDAERWSRDSLATVSSEGLDRDRRRLALDISELHQLSVHLPFDTARLLPRVRTLRALQAELSMLLPLASAVDDRIKELVRSGVPLRPVAVQLVEDIRSWLEHPVASHEHVSDADTLIDRARELEPEAQGQVGWSDALRLSLFARLAELIEAHRNVRILRDQMVSPSRSTLSSDVARLLAAVRARPIHRDHAIALRTAAGASLTVLLGCIGWIATGWSDGGGAVLSAGVACALFGNLDEPGPTVMKFLYGTGIGLVVAAIYAFAILPSVTDFVTLAAVLAPTLLLGGALLSRPKTGLFALGALLSGLTTVGLGDRYSGDFASFINSCVAQMAGCVLAVIGVRLFQTVGARRSAARLIAAGWAELARDAVAPGKPDAFGWIARMLDRIALLAPRLASQGQEPGPSLIDALADLRVGITIGELRSLRSTGTSEASLLITPVLRGVSGHYRALRPHRPVAPEPLLLASIDRALAGISSHELGENRRQGVLALTSLRRNLFPGAACFGEAA